MSAERVLKGGGWRWGGRGVRGGGWVEGEREGPSRCHLENEKPFGAQAGRLIKRHCVLPRAALLLLQPPSLLLLQLPSLPRHLCGRGPSYVGYAAAAYA